MKLQPIKKHQRYQYVGTRLDDETKDKLTEICNTVGVSIAEGLKQLIMQYIEIELKKRAKSVTDSKK